MSWLKSSFSAVNGCLEVAAAPDGLIAVRQSKDPDGGYILYNSEEWRAFLAGVRNGEFDHFAS
ncbi:hypothetical protein GCM10022223_44260 [Kineosporia mesophila]|uniref:DUF397 domain-containing protein n=1 Tax=Kineosporia mesophila TaxID=566012 RepID=A0ABP7A143_9ACTN|nr:DUF397 domain-containing protein [Kineosporia mesophila]MCD5348850.1 DUF397 domain-containing protein [Kineosporia mesophila]